MTTTQDPDEIVSLFTPADGRIYLDSATYGLPPQPTIEALREALDGWQAGTARWIEDWDREAEACRHHLARLIRAADREVALMPAVSVASGIVATAVPADGEVLLAEGDFTSMTFPFLAAAEQRRLRVRVAPLDRLADEVTERTDLVAVSMVQSSDGRVVDLEALREACRRSDARIYVDASQALGLLPLDVGTLGIDYLSVAGYKWLCCPRGVAWLYVRKELWQEPWPIAASWRAGDDPYGRFYGTTLALAPDAGRFDISLAWHPWVGARHSLEVLRRLDDATRFRLGHGAACRFAGTLGLEPPAAGIVAVPVSDSAAAAKALDEAGIRVASRAGLIRVAFHFYNTPDDADAAARLLEPFVARSAG